MKKTYVWILGIAVICLIIVLAWPTQPVIAPVNIVSEKKASTTTLPVAQICNQDAKICPDGSSVGRGGPQCEFAACPSQQITWKMTASADKKDGTPQTKVTLIIGKKEIPAGIHDGSCSDISTTGWKLLPNEKSGVICWFAGGGTELGVFEESGSLVLKQGFLDEGDAETAGTRGGFKLLLKI